MNVIGKVQDGGSLGKLQQITFRREDIDFIFVEVHLELVHQLKVVIILQGRTDIGQPFVNAAFTLNAFVTPVGSKAVLGNFVHTIGAYLHLDPFVLGAKDRDV